MEGSKQLLGHSCALFSAIVWGTTYVVSKILMSSFSTAEILLFRFVIAYACLWFLSLSQKKDTVMVPKEKSKLDTVLFFGAGLCGLSLYGTFEILSMAYTYASNTSVIVSTTPFFTGLVSAYILKQSKLKWNFFTGFLVAIIGLLLISFNGATEFGLSPKGDLLALAASIFWAFYSMFVKLLADRGYDTITSTRKIYFFGSISMALLYPLFGINTDFSRFFNVSNLLSLLYLAVVASAACFIAFNYATKTLGNIKSSVYIYTIPVVTIVFSTIFLQERINFKSTLGIALVLFGTVLSSVS
ncbi:MAG: DMT family transporter [Sphaerochaetaceae bacterium]|nr:DMT family transporter [Sphaerochaetaceae bacterium]